MRPFLRHGGSDRAALHGKPVRRAVRRLQIEPLESRVALNGSWQNPIYARDVNDDGIVVPLDALVQVNQLNSRTIVAADGRLPDRTSHAAAPFYDANGDGFLVPNDVLLVINALNNDVLPPNVTVQLARDTAPQGGTNDDRLTSEPILSGVVRDDLTGVRSLTASVNGGAAVPVTFSRDGTFQFDPGLDMDGTDDGTVTIELAAQDALFNTSEPRGITFQFDATPPVITIDNPAPGLSTDSNVTVDGTVTDEGSGIEVLQANVDNGAFFEVTPTTAGGFSLNTTLALDGSADGDHIVGLRGMDRAGNLSAVSQVTFRLDTQSRLLDQSTATTLAAATRFLYTGASPAQTGLVPETIAPTRVAVLRGRVLDRAGTPLAQVKVSVLDHSEFGSTLTGADGTYNMVVNGGGRLTLKYVAAGYLSAQRTTDVPWQDYQLIDDVVLTPPDSVVSTIDLNAALPVQVARGSVVTDAEGTRQSTLLFSQDTHATMMLPDGTAQPLSILSVRATEYTVGPNGLLAMPAQLPPASGYTYAVELSIDEATAAGATTVTFDKPVYNYVENFLNFPIGIVVPAGYYDPSQARWVPSDNGRVVKIVSETNGLAVIDGNGDGGADTSTELEALDFTDAERERLAELYDPGQSLWRVPIRHFSPWDYNWPYGPPAGARPPQQRKPPNPQGCGCDDCQGEGSIIGFTSQSLGESVPLAGTPYQLHYTSTRAPGRLDHYTVEGPLTGDSPPEGLNRISVELTVAGRRLKQVFAAAPNLSYRITWDGKDAFGRTVQGTQPAQVKIEYVYAAVYQEPAQFAQSFGAFSGVPLVGNPARQEITLPQVFEVRLGHMDARGAGLGGWNLTNHHVYDPAGQTLYFGDGTTQSILNGGFQSIIDTIAGTGTAGFGGDGGPAVLARFDTPVGLRYGPDGSLYVSDANNHRIRKIDPSGVIRTIAGTGAPGYSGDGGAGVAASLNIPASLDVASDGSIIFYDAGNNRVRRIAPDGTIRTIAGTGNPGFSGDGGPATLARIDATIFLRTSPDGSVYLVEANRHRIRRVGPDGVIQTVIGTGTPGFDGDGGPAARALLNFPGGLAIGPDGSIYIADGLNGRIRRVDPGGIITTYAGGGGGTEQGNGDGGPALLASFEFFAGSSVHADLDIGPDGSLFVTEKGLSVVRRIGPDGIVATVAGTTGLRGFAGDGGPATAARLNRAPFLTVSPDGSLVINDQANGRLRRVAPTLTGFHAAEIAIPSSDGEEVYQFTAQGRHLRTLDAVTGVTIHAFTYDAAGRLVGVTDRDGNVTTIERAATGAPTAVVAPFGHRTALEVGAEGYLSRITDPTGGSVQVTYSASGLLRTYTDPLGMVSTMTYDDLGRLIRDENTAGGSTTLTRSESGDTHTITATTAEGRTSTFEITDLGTGGRRQVVVESDGSQTVKLTDPDGSTTVTYSDGTVVTTKYGPDPRFGMLSPLVVSEIEATPHGVTSRLSQSRDVTSVPGNPLSVRQYVEKITVNDQIYTTTYDAASRTITSQSPEGLTSIRTLDARGNVIREEVPGEIPTDYSYDDRGRIIQVKQGSRLVTFDYGADGLLERVTDPLGQTVRYTRDAGGRVVQERQPDGQEIRLAYDAAGNVKSMTPPGRAAHEFNYSVAGDLTSYVPPDLGPGSESTQENYNADRQVTQVSRPDGTIIGLTYDSGGRLETVTTAGGTTSFHYDPTSGQLSGITAPGGEGLAYVRDGSLLSSVTWSGPVAGRVSAVFDSNRRVVQEMVNTTQAIDFQYDRDGHLTQAGALRLDRDAGTRRVTGTTLNKVTDEFGFDSFGDVNSYQVSFNGAPLFQRTDSFDALGRLTGRMETVEGATHAFEYAYDAVGRLTEVKQDNVVTAAFGYDANGNRLSFAGPGEAAAALHDAHDRLIQYGDVAYTYSLAGQLRTRTDADGTTTYDYDALGNLRSATLATGAKIEYVIDGANRRVGKRVNGTLVQGFLYSSQIRPVAELDGAGNLVSRFVYATGVNVPDYLIKEGVTYRLITDQIGSVRLVVDAETGAVVQRIDYDPFGRVLEDTNPGFQPFGFAGGLYDRDTGLVRLGARDYDAETGRWTAPDPLGFGGGQTNLYAYAANDPINGLDPTGLAGWRDLAEPLFNMLHGKQRQSVIDENNGTAYRAGLRQRRDQLLEHIDELKRKLQHERCRQKRKQLADAIAANQRAVDQLKRQIDYNLDTLNTDNKISAVARGASAVTPLGAAGEILSGSYKTPLDFSH